MTTTIILLLLCAIEALFIYLKWSEVQEYIDITEKVAGITGIDKTTQYGIFTKLLGRLLKIGSYILILMMPILFIINLIIALILGMIINTIL